MDKDLESLYKEAKSALKGRDYVRSSDLLRQILQIDENYRDTSRLLAQMVKLRRRKWYNHPLLWGILGAAAIIVLGIRLAPRISVKAEPVFTATQSTIPPITLMPSETAIPSATPTLIPTAIPLTWKRLSLGQEFARDEVTVIYQDANDKDLMLVKTSRAGVYKSINGGVSWQPTGEMIKNTPNAENNPELRLPGECVVLVSDPGNNRIAYCGVEKGIYRTSDAGQNWELSNPKVGWVRAITISPHNPRVIFAGGQGFSISEDGGESWQIFNNGLPNVPIELKIFSKDQTILFGQAVTDFARPTFRSLDSGKTWLNIRTDSCELMFDAEGNPTCGFWKSYDGGTTWINIFYSRITGYEISGYPATIGANYPYSSTSLMFFPYGKTFPYFVSHDLGKTWTHSAETDGWGDNILFSFDHYDGKVIYASDIQGDSTPILYRSNDYGEHWNTCSAPAGAAIFDTDTSLAIDYDDSSHLFMATRGNGIYLSFDGCKSWQSSNTGLDSLYVNSIVVTPKDHNTIYAGTDGGAHVSFDGGQTWGQINDGLLGALVIYSIVVDKDSNVYAATPYGIFKLESK